MVVFVAAVMVAEKKGMRAPLAALEAASQGETVQTDSGKLVDAMVVAVEREELPAA